ncbi:MAG: hypothetical protein HC910_21825 [Spirulinaceae cyanobacterium SM2_1_0]|nr:hypothetical protein [Spirulinaceae cyanobacterium SM2_1_0]
MIDASRLDLLHTAGAEAAKLLIVAIDDAEKSLQTIDLAQKHFPHLDILVRAIDRRHAYELIHRGVAALERETFESALSMGVKALRLLGFRADRSQRAAQIFRQYDLAAMHKMAAMHKDERRLVARSRRLTADLEEILQSDDHDFAEEAERAGDTTALRAETGDRI